MEPYRKRRWRKQSSPEHLQFFTCARPGRSHGSTQLVPDSIVHQWVTGLPGPRTTIISLLGHKPARTSEFSFYSFHGKDDTARESRGKQSFQVWLEQHHAGISLIEHPTTDFRPIPDEILVAIAHDVERLLAKGDTIILIDSGGQTRTDMVCKHLGLIEDPRT